jgi:hypothetical protein
MGAGPTPNGRIASAGGRVLSSRQFWDIMLQSCSGQPLFQLFAQHHSQERRVSARRGNNRPNVPKPVAARLPAGPLTQGSGVRARRVAGSARIQVLVPRHFQMVPWTVEPETKGRRTEIGEPFLLHSFSHSPGLLGAPRRRDRHRTARLAHSNAFVFGRNLLVGVVRQQRGRDDADDRAYQDIERNRQT